MIKSSAIFIILIFAPAVFAEGNIVNGYLVGKYLLVGKGIDTNNSYTGKVEIFLENDQLKVKRTVNSKVAEGKAAIESALGGEAEVLRFRYMEAGKHYEQTCLWQGDLDNHARISCYVYEPGARTNNPGLEVLFHDHTAK